MTSQNDHYKSQQMARRKYDVTIVFIITFGIYSQKMYTTVNTR